MTQSSPIQILPYRKDFISYAADLLWIVTVKRTLTKLHLNPVQLYVHNLIQPLIDTGRVFIYILKARQTGISTYSEARIFHSAHLWPNTRAGVVADEVERAEQIFKMTRLFYEKLPKQIRPMTRYSTKRELIFENPSKHGRFDSPGLGSSIEVFTAGNANIGRGFTFNVGHLSEWAFYPNGPEIIDALIPTVHNVPGNFIIFETTPDCAGSFAHHEWNRFKSSYQKARHAGVRTELLPIFIPWWEFSEYSVPFSSEAEHQYLMNSLDDEERTLIKRFNLKPEQLNWRRLQIDAMKGDLEAFRKEYPSDDEECWLMAGQPIFSRTQLNKAWQNLSSHCWRGEITPNGDLTPSDSGRLLIFHKPDPNRRYVMGVDPSGGEHDEACIQILDAQTLEQVAEWAGIVNSIELTQYIYPLGLVYGGSEGQALLAIEVTGGWGLSAQNELMDRYWNMYRWQRFDSIGMPVTEKVGWVTSVRTKPLLVDFGQYCFNQNLAKVNSPLLLQEMAKFTRVGNQVAGTKDDRVMAWLIAVYVAGSGRSDMVQFNHNAAKEARVSSFDCINKFKQQSALYIAGGFNQDYTEPVTELSWMDY